MISVRSSDKMEERYDEEMTKQESPCVDYFDQTSGTCGAIVRNGLDRLMGDKS